MNDERHRRMAWMGKCEMLEMQPKVQWFMTRCVSVSSARLLGVYVIYLSAMMTRQMYSLHLNVHNMWVVGISVNSLFVRCLALLLWSRSEIFSMYYFGRAVLVWWCAVTKAYANGFFSFHSLNSLVGSRYIWRHMTTTLHGLCLWRMACHDSYFVHNSRDIWTWYMLCVLRCRI